MANTIGTAYIQIEPTTQGISGKISNILDKDATAAGTSAGSKLSTALGGAFKAGSVAVAGLTVAFTAATKSIVDGAKATAEYGDNVDKMSQKLGVSSTFYQEWDAVLQHSGTSMDSMSSTFKKLANASQDATADQQAAFEALGLSMEQVSSMSAEELFSSVITGLQGMEEGTERTAIATDLLGKGSMELGALLNTSAEDTQEMIDTVHELGGVMSEDGVKQAAAFQDSLQNMQTAFAGVKNKMMSEFLPSITEVMDGLGKLASGDSSGIEQIQNGISEFVTNLSSMIPQIMKTAGEIIKGFASALLDNLPLIIDAAVNLVNEVINYLIENFPSIISTLLPALIQGAIQLVVNLVSHLPEIIKALIESIPIIIEAIVEGFLGLGEALWDLAGDIWEGIKNVFSGVGEWFSEKWSDAKEKTKQSWDGTKQYFADTWENTKKSYAKAGEWFKENFAKARENTKSSWSGITNWFSGIWDKIKNVFGNAKEKFLSIGKNIVEGIKNGITNAWSSFTSWVTGKFQSIIDGAKKVFGIASPSKVFRDEVGKWIPEGLAVGIEGNMDSLDESMGIMQDTLDPSQLDVSRNYAMNYDTTSNNDGIIALLTQYLPQLANMQIMLDGGALVGATAPAMNDALGKISAREVYR